MSAVGVLIVFALLGSFMCARSRVAGGAIVFAVIATVLFVGTPVGSGLPGLAADLVSAIDRSSAPLTQGVHTSAGVG